jgi:hypothetical protein
MDFAITTSENQLTFREFLFRSRRHRINFYVAASAIIIQFAVFKYLYPFASYIHGDSFSYLGAAQNNLSINTYLIGYSKFLRIFNTFAKPDFMLVAFQYLFIQLSVLFLLFTIFYFYKPGRTAQLFLICFMVFNPLFLHLSNMVSSDGFFLASSCTWFALLLWIIHKPSNKIIFWQAIVLFVSFTTRYNALIYPLIAGFAFLLSKLTWKKKMIGFSSGLILCGLFVAFTMIQYKNLTGYWQYSPFSGWQFANNAMYAYRSVDSADRKPVPSKFQALDNSIRNFYNKNKNKARYVIEQGEASTVYMWTPQMPLMQYRDSLFKKTKDSLAEFKKWATMGPFYKEYGVLIIRQYPWHFLRYFIWPNFRKYYAPPVEFLEEYNSGKRRVNEMTKVWFGYKSLEVKVRMGDNKVWILDFYPILSGVINLIMLFGLIYYILLKGWRYNLIFNKIILLASAVWLLNAAFTIFASSVALRFQSFPVILTTTFSLLLIDWMRQLMMRLKMEVGNQSKPIMPLEGTSVNKEQALA